MFDKSYEASNFPNVRPEWLARRAEAPLEPALPIVDSHHHLWDVASCPYRMPDLVADVSTGHNVIASVYVEAKSHYRTEGPSDLRPVGETEFAVAEAACLPPGHPGFDPCAGIVGYADLSLGSRVQAVLEDHIERGKGRFQGVRTRAAWHADDRLRGPADGPPAGLLLEPRFGEGIDCLGRLGLALDVWVYHTQLDEVAELAAAHPDTFMVLDHSGGPLGIGPYEGRREEVFRDWSRAIRNLGRFPNLFVKIGGFGMPRIGFGFERRESPPDSDELVRLLFPYFEVCLEAFGPERSMFESNFPVDKGAYSYTVLWNAFKKLCKPASGGERAALLSATASSFYRLPGALQRMALSV